MENSNFNLHNSGVAPQNFMVLAIISTILGCCSLWGIGFILGLVAVYFASQVNPKFYQGDIAAAEKNSKNARILSFIALALFVIGLIYTSYMWYSNPEIIEESQQRAREMMEAWGMEQPD
ncbi:MAG: CD225/dispanin family protein [Flavobacteriaceae bacterium]|nr:CD225/dispanin family protein [Flavobacteriaceae bacterium]